MIRFFALFLALTMTLSLTTFAGEFNAGVAFGTDTDGNITVTVKDSNLFDTQDVTLTVDVDSDLETAYVVFGGKAVTSTFADGKITFSVIDGGTYTIKEGSPSADELPDEPDPDEPDPDEPDPDDPNPDNPNPDNPNPDNPNPDNPNPDNPNPDNPNTPDIPSEPDLPSAPVKPPVSSDDEEPQEPQQPEQPQQPGVQPPFGDVKEDDWFYADVAWAYENGLMKGMPDGTFAPGVATSRGMIVTILWRLEGQPAPVSTSPFADVKIGSYYEQAIAWAAENQIVNGVSETAFQPDTSITREQFATILYRYAKNYKGCDVSVGEDTNILSYNDAFSISDYAFPALQWACGAGLMNGSGDALMPGSFATRAQAAALLHRFYQSY